MTQQIPAGLLNDNAEFFSAGADQLYEVTSGRVVDFDHFDDSVLFAANNELHKYPLKLNALRKMTGTSNLSVNIKQFLICNYSAFDTVPDFVDGLFKSTEYCPCPKRGFCKFEGTVCDDLKTDTGHFLSKREVQITRLIAKGFLDKNIAQALNLSLGTVTTHTRNIRIKTGLERKADITRFAFQKNLL